MDKDLEKAYMAGLDASLWWQKFVEFLYETPGGREVRRELARDYVTWQKQTQEFNPQARLIVWQEMFEKMFPSSVGKPSEKQKVERIRKAKRKAKVRVIEKKPKAVKKAAVNKGKKKAKAIKNPKKKTSGAGAFKFKNI